MIKNKNKISVGALTVIQLLRDPTDKDVYMVRNNKNGNIIPIMEIESKLLFENIKNDKN